MGGDAWAERPLSWAFWEVKVSAQAQLEHKISLKKNEERSEYTFLVLRQRSNNAS